MVRTTATYTEILVSSRMPCSSQRRFLSLPKAALAFAMRELMSSSALSRHAVNCIQHLEGWHLPTVVSLRRVLSCCERWSSWIIGSRAEISLINIQLTEAIDLHANCPYMVWEYVHSEVWLRSWCRRRWRKCNENRQPPVVILFSVPCTNYVIMTWPTETGIHLLDVQSEC